MNHYINIQESCAFINFSSTLYSLLEEKLPLHNEIVFLCIGTDRSTGDSLGPLVGHKISSLTFENVHVFGTLDNPVHAKNLVEVINNINTSFSNPLIIAIDACLGTIAHVGCISIMDSALRPGSGVKKDLPQVGHISIVGIVNFSGFMDFLILQNTRLSLVVKMADLISLGIKYSLHRINNHIDNKNPKTLDFQNIIFQDYN